MSLLDTDLSGLFETSGVRPLRFVAGVVRDDGDPLGLARVRVEAPELPGSTLSPWLRVRSPDGRPMDGRVSVPEVGTAVLLAVWEDSANLEAVVLGALHAGEPPVPGPVGARVGELRAQVLEGARLVADAVGEGALRLELDAAKGAVRLKGASLGVGGEACTVKIKAGSLRMVVTGAARIQGKTVALAASGGVAMSGKTAALVAPRLDLDPG